MISTEKLYIALGYYEGLGYQMIDVPLLVDFDVSQVTKPEGKPELHHLGKKVYPASAEQCFIQLHRGGKLPNGKFMAVTPCYRHESTLSDTKYLMFLKLELINVGVSDQDSVEQMSDDAGKLFIQLGHVINKEYFSDDTIDIVTEDDLELGSYGCRYMLDGTEYIYGTGLALPRISHYE